jgi:asparagine synthase (glutamine-hydrolysing)
VGKMLRGGSGELRTWCGARSDERRAVGVAVRVPGLLPEDRFDVQPLLSEDGGYLVVCQARLDNREELIEALAISDRPAGELPDSLILQRAFLKWGEGCVDHLTGDYAFAAYSLLRDELFCAVDHVGHYRLYYAAAGRRIVLSTQLAAIRACPGISTGVNEVSLGLLAEAQFQKGETPYREIQSLPGGHCLKWKRGEVQVRRWWQPEVQPKAQFRNPDDYVEKAQELLNRAVRSCLRSSTPVSATLSGGLDSGLVTATAARLLLDAGLQMTAYTAAPRPEDATFRRRGWEPDDAPYAAETAALHPNLQHVILRSDGRVALDLMLQMHERSGTPVRNGANHLWIDSIARAAVASGSRVLLTGALGNFAISYTGLGGFRELFRQMQLRAAFRLAMEVQGAGERAAWKTIARGVVPPRVFEAVRSRLYEEKVAKDLLLPLTSAAFRRQHRAKLRRSRPPQGTRQAFLRRATASALIWAADPLPQWDIEMRDPTSDRRLLEGLLSFPLAAFSYAGRSRGLARELGKGILPDAVRLRRTQGQQAADYACSMARQSVRYQEAIAAMAASPVCRSIFDPEAMNRAINMVAGGETSGFLTARLDRAVDAGLFLLSDHRDCQGEG